MIPQSSAEIDTDTCSPGPVLFLSTCPGKHLPWGVDGVALPPRRQALWLEGLACFRAVSLASNVT